MLRCVLCGNQFHVVPNLSFMDFCTFMVLPVSFMCFWQNKCVCVCVCVYVCVYACVCHSVCVCARIFVPYMYALSPQVSLLQAKAFM